MIFRMEPVCLSGSRQTSSRVHDYLARSRLRPADTLPLAARRNWTRPSVRQPTSWRRRSAVRLESGFARAVRGQKLQFVRSRCTASTELWVCSVRQGVALAARELAKALPVDADKVAIVPGLRFLGANLGIPWAHQVLDEDAGPGVLIGIPRIVGHLALTVCSTSR